MKSIFECRSEFNCSAEKLFAFHENPEGFQTLVGLDKNVNVIQAPASIQKGSTAILEVIVPPGIKSRWTAVHTEFIKNELFVDEQKQGPFVSFRHEHRFFTKGNKSILNDHIEFEFHFNFIAKYFVAMKFHDQFLERHRATAEYLKVEYQNLFCGLV